MNWHTILGIASGVVLLCGNVPYISSIRRGETRPNRVTWGIWTTIGFILLGSSYSIGATNTLWLQIAQVFSQVIITFYVFKYSRGQWYFLDRVCLAGASLSLLFWWQSGSPFVALLMNIAMDILGAVFYLGCIKLICDRELLDRIYCISNIFIYFECSHPDTADSEGSSQIVPTATQKLFFEPAAIFRIWLGSLRMRTGK